MVEEDIRKLKVNKSKHNIIWKTIKEMENIIIRPADKGGSLVVINKHYYETEMNKLLSVPDAYKKNSEETQRGNTRRS